jgi:nucleoside phosphorylase
MIGLLIADKNESKKIPFPYKETIKTKHFVFNVYNTPKDELVVCHAGIGLVNAAAATQALIDNFDISLIYNYGAVGGGDKVNVYDLIIPYKIYYFDIVTP